jgi:GNAT superfamily N-acetyltransferase
MMHLVTKKKSRGIMSSKILGEQSQFHEIEIQNQGEKQLKIHSVSNNLNNIKVQTKEKIFFPDNYSYDKIIQLRELINHCYHKEEDSLIHSSIDRTSFEELASLIEKEEILNVEVDSRIVASILFQKIDESTHKFGMLVTHPDYRGKGLGSKLISLAEKYAKERCSKYMCLELLTPNEWVHEQKKFLSEWYQRLGYRQTSLNEFPHKELLITPCSFFVFTKEL